MAEEMGLLNTGATESFINHKTVIKHWLGTQKLPISQPVHNVNRTANKSGMITDICYLMVSKGNKKERVPFYVTNPGKDHFIFSYPWCQEFQPDINWANSKLKGPKIKVETLLYGKYQHIKAYLNKVEDKDFTISQAVCPLCSRVTFAEMQGGWVEINRTNTAIDMAHKYAEEHKKATVILPEEFKEHAALFSDKEAKAFPPAQEWDHKIELTEDAPASFNMKIYPMSKKEQEEEDNFLDKNLAKGYIVPSDSPYGFSMFMVPKKDSNEL